MRGEQNMIGQNREEKRRRSDGRREEVEEEEEEQLQGSVAAQKPQRRATCEAVSAR